MDEEKSSAYFLLRLNECMNKDNKPTKIAKHIADVMMQVGSEKNKDFDNWVEKNEFAPEVLKKLSNYDSLIENSKLFLVDIEERKRESQYLLKKIDKYNRRKLFIRISSIATALIVVLFVIWSNDSSISNRNPREIISSADREDHKIEIPKIITENGAEFYLKNQEKVVILNDSIIQQNGDVARINSHINDNVSYSSLVVPKQSTYTIELSDGTVVQLNANSKLRFPNKFIGSTREVSMEGEAFFIVAKDAKKPFIVTYKNTKIEVLGTQFNINTYSENIVKTFLVEGSVGVRYNNDMTMMHPNQLSVVNEITNSNTISNVSTTSRENIVAWLNDIFIFNNVEINEIIETLSKWYGEELIVNDNLNECITARYKRTTPLNEIIESLGIITSKQILK